MNRWLLIATLLGAAALSIGAELTPLEMEDASEAARRAATAAMHGARAAFLEALEVDEALEGRVGTAAWRGLTEQNRAALRATVRERILGMLAPPRPMPGEVAWSASFPGASGGVDVLLGLNLEAKTLKTRWRMRRTGSSWRVRDVLLSDPGISLTGAALATLGSDPVRARPAAAIRKEILPILSGLFVILLVVGLAAPRLTPGNRKYLYLAASVPALVFLAAGAAAAVRAGRQPYVLGMIPAGQPWQRSEELALKADRDGRAEDARILWEKALAAGEPPGPVAYERGLAAKQRGDVETARAFFQQALAAPAPAPGAAKELAALAAARGLLPEAERQIAGYLAAAGPDPDALSLEAVIKTDLGKSADALQAIVEARHLAGSGTRGAELEAQIRARAGDAAGAIAALRPLTKEGRLDRFVLRSDPAYLPIATDPAWVKFLSEK